MSLCQNDIAYDAPEWLTGEHMTGTTIMAVEFADGVVFGADSRTSTGTYVANRVTDKLTQVADKIYCCRSGSAADTQAIADYVKFYLDLQENETNEEPTVEVASRIFQMLCYHNRDMLSASIICAGWDKTNGGQVYCLPLGGMCVRMPFAIGGSGSTYIYGHCDNTYKTGMTEEECLKFVADAVALAMHRDGSSGGMIRLAVLTKDGCRRLNIPGNQLPTFWSK